MGAKGWVLTVENGQVCRHLRASWRGPFGWAGGMGSKKLTYPTPPVLSLCTSSLNLPLPPHHPHPQVLLCTNYEEAVDIFSRYSDNIIGVITDAGFPKEGVHDDQESDAPQPRVPAPPHPAPPHPRTPRTAPRAPHLARTHHRTHRRGPGLSFFSNG